MKLYSKTQHPNLIRRENGTYYAQTRVGGGRQRTQSLRTKGLSVALLKLPKALKRLRADRPAIDPTLGQCLAGYLERKRFQGHKGRFRWRERLNAICSVKLGRTTIISGL